MPQRPAGQIVTRFAPSPTGYLHIGGARTALFNWAFARRHNGVFILRIEDTDKARSTDAATAGILADLEWLGIDWDEGPAKGGQFGPYFQSQRDALYREYLEKLVKIGRAYRCFKTQEQLKAEREAQKAAGAPMKYDPTQSLSRSDADQQKLIDAGTPFVWRFRMPDAAVTVNDLVLGDVTIQPAELEDFVIVKGDGGPTFHFANVVDDATMQVTHVLRAQEHLMNTPKHVAMFDALGIARPKYAHMPLIFNVDGTKMSKRDKAKTARAAAKAAKLTAAPGVEAKPFAEFLDKKNDEAGIAIAVAAALNVQLPEIDVHDFRKSGYLQDVILNYIALLGWSPGGNLERFDLNWLKQNFNVEGIGKSNAKFDREKLKAFNGDTLQKMSPEAFRDRLASHLAGFHAAAFGALVKKPEFPLFAEAYRPRSRTLDEPTTLGKFFVVPDDAIVFDAKSVEKVLKKDGGAGLKTLSELAAAFEKIADWSPATLHGAIEEFARATGRGMGDVAQPLRVALTGSTVSPAIHDTLAILGKSSTLARIGRCVEHLK